MARTENPFGILGYSGVKAHSPQAIPSWVPWRQYQTFLDPLGGSQSSRAITSPALHTMGTSCLPPAGSGGISGTNRRSPCVGAVGSISVGAVFEPFRHQIVNDVEGVQRALLPQALG